MSAVRRGSVRWCTRSLNLRPAHGRVTSTACKNQSETLMSIMRVKWIEGGVVLGGCEVKVHEGRGISGGLRVCCREKWAVVESVQIWRGGVSRLQFEGFTSKLHLLECSRGTQYWLIIIIIGLIHHFLGDVLNQECLYHSATWIT